MLLIFKLESLVLVGAGIVHIIDAKRPPIETAQIEQFTPPMASRAEDAMRAQMMSWWISRAASTRKVRP
jgi:hypothetical protein